MVYFLQNGEYGNIKIGYAKDVDARQKQLQCASSKQLLLRASIPGTRDTEARLHQHFKVYKIDGGGEEWYSPNEELMNFIRAYSFLPKDKEDRIPAVAPKPTPKPRHTLIAKPPKKNVGAWLPHEIKLLRKHYPKLGDSGIVEHGLIPGRNENAVRSKAVHLGIRRA